MLKLYSTIINLLQKKNKSGQLCNLLDIKVFFNKHMNTYIQCVILKNTVRHV